MDLTHHKKNKIKNKKSKKINPKGIILFRQGMSTTENP
jgi:hypothetical protein